MGWAAGSSLMALIPVSRVLGASPSVVRRVSCLWFLVGLTRSPVGAIFVGT
jgi:hypothetical protein